MASVVLACKIEEEVRRVSEVILVFVHVYRRMRLAVDYNDAADDDDTDDHKDDITKDKATRTRKDALFQTACCSLLQNKKLTQDERKNILRYIQPLPRTGLVYKEWQEELLRAENVILRELGFSLYWIPESHPHVFLLYFMKVLELVDNVEDDKDDDKCNDQNNDHDDDNMSNNDSSSNKKEKVDKGSGKGIAQVAWNYCNDSCRLDLCVRYEPELIVS